MNDLEDIAMKSTEKGTIDTQGSEAAPPPAILRDQIQVLQFMNCSIITHKLNFILNAFRGAAKVKYLQISRNKNSLKSTTCNVINELI